MLFQQNLIFPRQGNRRQLLQNLKMKTSSLGSLNDACHERLNAFVRHEDDPLSRDNSAKPGYNTLVKTAEALVFDDLQQVQTKGAVGKMRATPVVRLAVESFMYSLSQHHHRQLFSSLELSRVVFEEQLLRGAVWFVRNSNGRRFPCCVRAATSTTKDEPVETAFASLPPKVLLYQQRRSAS